jgi:hypothetical protein
VVIHRVADQSVLQAIGQEGFRVHLLQFLKDHLTILNSWHPHLGHGPFDGFSALQRLQ